MFCFISVASRTHRVVLLPDVCAVLHALEDHVEVVVEDGLVEDLLQPQPPPRRVALLKFRHSNLHWSVLLSSYSEFERCSVPRNNTCY